MIDKPFAWMMIIMAIIFTPLTIIDFYHGNMGWGFWNLTLLIAYIAMAYNNYYIAEI